MIQSDTLYYYYLHIFFKFFCQIGVKSYIGENMKVSIPHSVCIRQCESLAQENEQLKEKVEELSVDLQIIKEEIATAGSVTYLLSVFSFSTLCLKNAIHLAYYNFDVYELILIIFWQKCYRESKQSKDASFSHLT